MATKQIHPRISICRMRNRWRETRLRTGVLIASSNSDGDSLFFALRSIMKIPMTKGTEHAFEIVSCQVARFVPGL